MAETFIRKIEPDPDGLDFEGLREEAFRLVQETSGDIWTDYNLHDPGVTILEAICYALTDLVYRTSFSAADYLATTNGTIDYKKQALYRPDEILPCSPVTENDYRKLILNAVPNLDNVWINRHTEPGASLEGLYRIYVLISEQVNDQDNASVSQVYISAVNQICAANRNLCEDLVGVEIVGRIPYSLRGEIETEGEKDSADLLAEIYFECAQYLSPKVSIQSYAEMYNAGSSLEYLLTGPLTEHGYIAEEELHPWRGHFSIPELVGRIDRIEGVKNVRCLVFVDDKGVESDRINLGDEHLYRSAACLRFSAAENELGIKLYKNGKAHAASSRDVEMEFSRLDYRHQALRKRKLRFDWVDAILPASTFRNVSEYYSFQNHFPNVYGLNAYGVPESASSERKAQARQLKAYLLFFEQVMANFLQHVQDIPRLFSLDEQSRQSYSYQVLSNDDVPNVEDIYVGDISQVDAKLAELMAGFDNFGDRRNRVLDYLLGIYGEKLSQSSLHQFFAEGTNVDDERIRNKIVFLKNIVDITKNRSQAFDYRKPSEDGIRNISGLNKRLKVLLGLMPDGSASSAEDTSEQSLAEADIRIVEHILLRPRGSADQLGHDVPEDFYSFRISIVFSSSFAQFANMEFRKLAEETVHLNCPAHIHPEIFWFESDMMNRFEAVHRVWLEAMQGAGLQSGKIDSASKQLVAFLLEIRGGK